MIYPPDMLDILQSAAVSAWSGTVYRHMFGSHPPMRTNTVGARWNDLGLAAIYTSCERETALAEAEYYINMQPVRPKAKRTLYTVRVFFEHVLDLTVPGLLARLGITDSILSSADHSPCRTIGGAVNWLGHDGLLVPSARRVSGTTSSFIDRISPRVSLKSSTKRSSRPTCGYDTLTARRDDEPRPFSP